MKEAMRAALKESLMKRKMGLRNKRAMAYAEPEPGETVEHELSESAEVEEQEHEMGDDSGSRSSRSGLPSEKKAGTDNKGLGRKVAEAEDAAHEEMEEAGDWRAESMRDFFKKKAAPKVRRAGTFVQTVKSAKKGKGEKKG